MTATLLLLLATAHAQQAPADLTAPTVALEVDASLPAPPSTTPDAPDARVVGGEDTPNGVWPDATYLSSGRGACTGTLIHPKWVLTAAHCLGGMREALVGESNNSARFDLEVSPTAARRGIIREVAYNPNWEAMRDLDIALVELDEPVTNVEPRIIGRECVVEEDLVEGAPVWVVGWGATQSNGNGSTNVLQQGQTTVQTADCSASDVDGIATGCFQAGGEVGAGGDGVDACFGDSGGPLYIDTPRGTYVIGATSRSYIGVPRNEPCKYGGIYTRPDAVIDWIQEVIGEELPHPACNPAPEVDAPEMMVLPPGGSRRSSLGLSGTEARGTRFEVVRQPLHGRVKVDPSGTFTVSADPDYRGMDGFVVRATSEAAEIPWPNSPPGSVEVFVPLDVGGNCDGCTSGAAPMGLPWLLLVAMVRRRERRSL